jgi:L-rhamnose mutarotase
VFSDVLYYVEYEKIIDQYIGYLNPNGTWLTFLWLEDMMAVSQSGIMIISIFHFKTDQILYENIFEYARKKMILIGESQLSYVWLSVTTNVLDELEVGGYTKKSETAAKQKTAFHIELYKLRH